MRSFTPIKVGVVATLTACLLANTGSVCVAQNNNAQQAVAELKQSMAANRSRLMKYQWIQSTEVSVKGETKKDEQMMCRYGPDGTVVKTPVGPQQQSQIPTRGLKGKIAQKKVGEMKDYTERLKSLISHYAPPDPAQLKAAAQIGNANVNSANGTVAMTFNDYFKAGDSVQLVFDPQAKKLVSYNVNTYLDDPKDVVTLTNNFAALPDGTSYLQRTVLDAKTKQIQVTTTNSDYSPVGP
jgi:hypothetical protein